MAFGVARSSVLEVYAHAHFDMTLVPAYSSRCVFSRLEVLFNNVNPVREVWSCSKEVHKLLSCLQMETEPLNDTFWQPILVINWSSAYSIRKGVVRWGRSFLPGVGTWLDAALLLVVSCS